MKPEIQGAATRLLYLYDIFVILIGAFFTFFAFVCFAGGPDAKPPSVVSTVAGIINLTIGGFVLRAGIGLAKSTTRKIRELECGKTPANKAL